MCVRVRAGFAYYYHQSPNFTANMDQPNSRGESACYRQLRSTLQIWRGSAPLPVLSVVAETMHGQGFLLYGSQVPCFRSSMLRCGASWVRPFLMAGGSYNFLKEGFRAKDGQADELPFHLANRDTSSAGDRFGSHRFCAICGYVFPLSFWGTKAVSGGVVILIVFLFIQKPLKRSARSVYCCGWAYSLPWHGS